MNFSYFPECNVSVCPKNKFRFDGKIAFPYNNNNNQGGIYCSMEIYGILCRSGRYLIIYRGVTK